MNITFNENSIKLSQNLYIETLLDRYVDENILPSNTLAVPKIYLTDASNEDQENFMRTGKNYRRLIGALNYISCITRPGIIFSVNTLSRSCKILEILIGRLESKFCNISNILRIMD